MSTPSPHPLKVNVFTAPEKPLAGDQPYPFGPALSWDPITATLIYGERDAVLVDALTTTAEANALADWVALHDRTLTTIYLTHGHFDHFYGLGILLDRFPQATAIATPESVHLMHDQLGSEWFQFANALLPEQLPANRVAAQPFDGDTFTLEGHELRIIRQGRTDTVHTPPRFTYRHWTSSWPATSSTTNATCSSATPHQKAEPTGSPPSTASRH